MKLVSVIMPCFNDGRFIMDSIKAVKQQTYKNIELMIIDDGSTDKNTINILENIQEDWIKIFQTNRRRPAGARNYGIQHAEGEFILPLDADDLIATTYVEKAVAILSGNENVGVVYCQGELFGDKKGRWKLPDYTLERMLLDNIVFVSAMFRKSDWQQVGGFNEELIYGMEDYDFWLSIIETGKEIVQIPEVLFYYRVKKGSRTFDFIADKDKMKETYLLIYNKHPELYNKYKDEYAVALRNAYIDKAYVIHLLNRKLWFIKKITKLPVLDKIFYNLTKEFRDD